MNFSSKLFDRSFVEWNSKILDEDKEGGVCRIVCTMSNRLRTIPTRKRTRSKCDDYKDSPAVKREPVFRVAELRYDLSQCSRKNTTSLGAWHAFLNLYRGFFAKSLHYYYYFAVSSTTTTTTTIVIYKYKRCRNFKTCRSEINKICCGL